jgi:hypothetical protein
MAQQILEDFKNLNQSERAREMLAPAVAKFLGHGAEAGSHIESLFSVFWQLARKADDMIDYSVSSDLKWLGVLQDIFSKCSKVQSILPKMTTIISLESWQKAVGHFFNLMSMTCKGEINDLLLRSPSLADYNNMVLLKTGPWFTGRIMCTALAIRFDNDNNNPEILKDLKEYGDLVSLAYQIRNDIRDIETEEKDIAIGKLNYPTILLLLEDPSLRYRYNGSIPKGLYYSHRAIESAIRTAKIYEEKAKKIARKYGSRELELLATELCTS